MVYLIENLNNSTYKIGYSKNPDKRLKTLQTATCDELKLVITIPGNTNVEKMLQDEFKEYHIKREWFSKTDVIFNKFLEFKIEKPILEKEPHNIAFTHKGLNILSILDNDTKNVILLLLKYNTSSNIIYLTSSYKRKLYSTLKISLDKFNKCIKQLMLYNIIMKYDKNYLINPELFIRDTWGKEIYILS